MPVDTAGRALELILVLEAHWRQNRRLARFPIVLLHHMAFNALEFARSEIECDAPPSPHAPAPISPPISPPISLLHHCLAAPSPTPTHPVSHHTSPHH